MNDPVNTFTFDPPSGKDVDIQDVCTWLIRVMNKRDKSVMFVSSVMAFFLQHGGVSEKQYDHLNRVFDRVLDAYERGALETQGAVTAVDDGTPANIVSFSAKRKPKGAA
ncbi:MAG: hypothetical protein QHC90_13320 [Shinella sp.]|nr:hypothetical protein [Shinella sp.]